MDFHGLSRRELQALCKLNKIPANITNVAMADALQSLDIVEGIEEYLNVSQPEAGDVVQQAKKVEVLSPKAPQTRCRTSTRQRKTTETDKVAGTRTTIRRGTKNVAGGVEESRKEMLKTPAISSSRRKAVETSSCRNVSSQLNECEDEADEEGVVDQKVEPAIMCTRRKVDAVKKESAVQKIESTVQKAYSTRRSTRVTEKKAAETRVKKDSGKAVKIDSFMDEEVNVESEETNVESENTNAVVENICNAFEKLDVLVVEKSDCSPVLEEAVDIEASNETSNPCEDLKVEEKLDLGEKDSSEAKDEPKPESDVISSPCEDESSEQNLDFGVEKSDASEAKDDTLIAPQEDADSLFDDNASLESGESLTQEDMSHAVSDVINNQVQEIDGSSKMASDMILDNSESDSEAESDNETESDNEKSLSPADKITPDASEPKDDTLIAPQEDADSLFDDSESDSEAESDNETESDNEKSLSPADKITSDASEPKDDTLIAPQEDADSLFDDSESDSEDESDNETESDNEKSLSPADKIILDASEPKDDTLIAPQEDADSLFDGDAILESGEIHHQEDMSHAVSEMKNEVQEIDGSSMMASDMMLDNSESDSEAESDNETESDNVKSLSPADKITTEDMEQVSKNTDNESFDVTSTIKFEDLKPELFTETNANEKADSGVSLNEEKSQFFVSAPCFPTRATPIKNATPFKNTSIVTDDKENIVVEGKKSKKEIDATAYSIRQLRKQIKALTLKSSGNEDVSKETATTRPALQAICENQMVGGETRN